MIGPAIDPMLKDADVNPNPLLKLSSPTRAAMYAENAGQDRFPAVNDKADITMKHVRVLEKGSRRIKGEPTSVDTIMIGLYPSLSDSLPPGIWAIAVAKPQPREYTSPISAGDAPITYMRNAVVIGERTPLPRPEKNCARHRRSNFLVGSFVELFLLWAKDDWCGEDMSPKVFLNIANKRSVINDNMNDNVNGKRKDTVFESKPPTIGAGIWLKIQERLNTPNNVPLNLLEIELATIAFNGGIRIP